MAFALSSCESDSTVAADQNPVEDQALAAAVMGARGDTLTAAVENEVIVDTSLPPDLRPVAPSTPPVTTSAALSPAIVQAQPIPPPRRVTTRSQPSVPTPTPLPVISESTREPAAERARPRAREESTAESPRRTGLISRGATLSVVTSRSVCNDAASVGNTVRGELSSSLRGTNGVVIPQGAHVVARITSVDKWGAGIGMQVTSVRVDGRSYPVRSRTEYVLPEGTNRGACIRDGTRLSVETKEPIIVSAR
jgi:hypothetical protein